MPEVPEGPEIDPKTGSGDTPEDPTAEDAYKKMEKAEKTALDSIETEGLAKAMIDLSKAQLDIVKQDIIDTVSDTDNATELGKYLDNMQSRIENSNYQTDGKPDNSKLLKSMFEDGSTGKLRSSDGTTDLFDNVDQTKAQAALDEYLAKYKGKSVAGLRDVFPNFMKDLTSDPTLKNRIDETTFTASDSVDRQTAAETLADNVVTPDKAQQFGKNAANRAAKDIEAGKLDSKGRMIDPKTIIKLLSLLLSIGGLLGFGWWTILTAMNLSGCKEVSCSGDDIFPTEKPVKCYQSGTPNIFDPNGPGTINFTSAACVCDPPDPNNPTQITACSSNACSATDGSQDNLRPYGPSCERANTVCNGDGVKCPFRSYTYSITTPFDAMGNIHNGAMNGFKGDANSIIDLLKKIGIYILIGLGVLLGLFLIYGLINKFLLSKNTNSKFGKLSNFGFNSNYFLKGNCKPFPHIKTKPILFNKKMSFA